MTDEVGWYVHVLLKLVVVGCVLVIAGGAGVLVWGEGCFRVVEAIWGV